MLVIGAEEGELQRIWTKYAGLLSWGAVVLAALASGPAVFGAADTLGQLRNHARVLLVFAPSAEDTRMGAQLRELRDHATELAERDLVTITVPLREPEARAQGTTLRTMDVAEGLAVRRRFRVGDGEFVIVLVGKDGGEKLRSRETLTFRRLREVIDAMPMRREEIRKKQ